MNDDKLLHTEEAIGRALESPWLVFLRRLDDTENPVNRDECDRALAFRDFDLMAMTSQQRATFLKKVLREDMTHVSFTEKIFRQDLAKPGCRRCHGSGSQGRILADKRQEGATLICDCVHKNLVSMMNS